MAHDNIIVTNFYVGSVDGEAFADFVRGSLIPQMQAFDGESERSIAVMDNCSVHHTEVITDLFREAGVILQAIDDPSPVIKAALSELDY